MILGCSVIDKYQALKMNRKILYMDRNVVDGWVLLSVDQIEAQLFHWEIVKSHYL